MKHEPLVPTFNQFDLFSIRNSSNKKPFVVEINKDDAKKIIQKYHYLGAKDFLCVRSFGLIVEDKLVGCAVYHGPSSPETCVGAFGLDRNNQSGFWELGRLVLKSDKNGKNFGSILIGKSIRALRKLEECRAIITYAESEKHYGAIYQATNFIYCGLTKKKKDFILPNGKIIERGKTKNLSGIWKDRPRKHRYIMIFDKQLTLLWEQQKYIKPDALSTAASPQEE